MKPPVPYIQKESLRVLLSWQMGLTVPGICIVAIDAMIYWCLGMLGL